MTSFALFYNHLCLGDTIVMVSDFSATIKRWERKDDALGLEIEIEKNTYVLGKVISVEEKNIEVDINGNTIYCKSDSNVNEDDYVVVARNNERLPNGRLVKDVVPNGYGFITEIAFNATDSDLGKNIY